MVEKITLFELHADDARFGTNDDLGDSTRVTEHAETDPEASEKGGLSVRRLVLASLFVSIAVSAIVRRLFADAEPTEASIEIEDPDAELEVES
ncbi:MAG: hypothetical protein V5A34_09410 [Halapricum sp.]|jgi:hypothetical protein